MYKNRYEYRRHIHRGRCRPLAMGPEIVVPQIDEIDIPQTNVDFD